MGENGAIKYMPSFQRKTKKGMKDIKRVRQKESTK
jgi:hypothetical protein